LPRPSAARARSVSATAEVPTAKRRQIRERPVGGVTAGPGDDLFVGGRLLAMQKTEHRAEWRKADAPIAHAGGLNQFS
jgi:hypothetical protein